MIKLDLHSFFDTITERMVFKVFRELGYSKLVSFELARITTRSQGIERPPFRLATHAIPSYVVSPEGRLPQGAPTSGQLANAVARSLDCKLQEYSREKGFVYTRYSDDLVFSSFELFQRERATSAMRDISDIIQKSGFFAHRKKTRVVPPGARKIVLGLLVDDTVRLLPEHRRRIEVHLRGCEEFGLARHAEHRGFESVFSFVNHLGGWIAFAIGVEPLRARAWRERLHQVLAKNGIDVTP